MPLTLKTETPPLKGLPSADTVSPPPTVDRQVLAALALVMALVSVYATRLADPDFYGNLVYGRFFVEQGPYAADPFAYTSTGRQWYCHEYLSQVVLWEAYALGGPAGLILFKCLVGGAAVLCIYGAVRQAGGDARTWAPIFILTAGLVARSFHFRPQLFSFLFFSFMVLILFRHLLGRRGWLWTLPPVLAVWANCHGAYLAGVGAVGLALLLRGLQSVYRGGFHLRGLWNDTWPLGCTLAVCLAATLLNPLGWRLWVYVLTEMTHDTNRRFIEEWRPLELPKHTWSAVTLGLVLLGLLFAGVLAQTKRRSESGDGTGLPPWVWLLSCLPLTVMAFQAVRHIPFLTIWAAPVLALLAHSAAAGVARPGRPWHPQVWERGWLAFTGAVGMVALLTVFLVAQNPRPAIAQATALGETRPFRVTAFLRVNELRGNVYNPLWWGSYLTWELYPEVKVAMDGRNVTLFPIEMVEENLLYFTEGTRADAPLSYPTDFLLVPADSPILPRVDANSWFPIYDDGDAVLFVRADAAHEDVIRRAREGRLRTPEMKEPEYFQQEKR